VATLFVEGWQQSNTQLYNIFMRHNGNTQTAQTTALQMKQRKTDTHPTANA